MTGKKRQWDYHAFVEWRKTHNLKLQVKFYSSILLKTLVWEAASQIALRNCSKREKGGAKIYRSFSLEKKNVVEHQKITANHKEQISQVNDFGAFLSMGRSTIHQ